MSTDLALDQHMCSSSMTEQAETAYYRREIESLRARLDVAERQLGSTWTRKKGSKKTQREHAQAILKRPTKSLEWHHLDVVGTALGDEAGDALWQRLYSSAVRSFDSGSSAASAVLKGYSFQPYDRARFLVIRNSLVEEWKPQNTIEVLLIDQIAQCLFAYEHWLGVHMAEATVAPLPEPELFAGSMANGAWNLPTLNCSEAQQHSIGMATRWQNQMVRLIRALRDLRRHSPVIVQNAGQVNVAQQQVNMAEGSSLP